MVLFAVEHRKAWRRLQSKAGVANTDCPPKRPCGPSWTKMSSSQADGQAKTNELFEAELAKLN